MALTPYHYNATIFQLESIGVPVLISACDQGPRNCGLAKLLGVSTENVEVINPFDSSRFVLFSFDFVHVFKNLRNHFLDDLFRVSKNVFSKADFEELFEKVNASTLRITKLKGMHLNCKNSDRQSVKLAAELLSNTVSTLMKDFFPNCQKKQELSEIISLFDKGFNLMTSRMANVEAKEFSKQPLRKCLAQQFSCLKELIQVVKSLEFQNTTSKKAKKGLAKWGKVPCQKGAIISITCAMKLQVILAEKYYQPHYSTEPTTQDDLECEFGINRGMNGSDNKPSAIQFNSRTTSRVIELILKDSSFDIFDLENVIRNCDKYKFNYDDINRIQDAERAEAEEKARAAKPKPKRTRAPKNPKSPFERKSELEQLEIVHVAGLIAHKFKDESLSSSGVLHDVQTKSLLLTKSIKEGLIVAPSKDWLNEVTIMYNLFERHHPLPKLRQGPGLNSNFTKILVEKFPHRTFETLNEFTTIRTNLQIKLINTLAREGKKSTSRGARNLVETINS